MADALALQQVLEVVLARGARLATPGEFTKRAFLNGRIDLSQAESVLDVIRAETTRACNWQSSSSRANFQSKLNPFEIKLRNYWLRLKLRLISLMKILRSSLPKLTTRFSLIWLLLNNYSQALRKEQFSVKG